MRTNRVRRKSKMRSKTTRNKVNRKNKKNSKKTKKRTNKRIKKRTRKLRGGAKAGKGVPASAAVAPTKVGKLPGIRDKQGPTDLSTEAEMRALGSVPLSEILGPDGNEIIDDPLAYRATEVETEMTLLNSDITRQAGIIKGLASEKEMLESELLVQRQVAQGALKTAARLPQLMSENKQLKTENQRLRTENQRLRTDCEI